MTTPFPSTPSDPEPTGAVETVRLQNAADLLTAVPYVLGFHPSQCIVVLALDQDGRVLVTVRVELPNPVKVAAEAAGVAQALGHVEAAEVFVVGYCDHASAPQLTAFAAALPWPVLDLLLVQADRWWSLACPEDSDCCPQGDHLVVQDHVAAPMLAAAGAPAASRDALAAGLAAGPPQVLDDVLAHLQVPCLLDSVDLYTAAGRARAARTDGPVAMPADTAAVLLHAVHDVMVRDACTLWHDEPALRLWLDLLPAAPAGWVAPVATLLAAAAYQRGDGALAVMALERALDDDPDYTLAHLLGQVAAVGLPPHRVTAVLTEALAVNPLAHRDPPTT